MNPCLCSENTTVCQNIYIESYLFIKFSYSHPFFHQVIGKKMCNLTGSIVDKGYSLPLISSNTISSNNLLTETLLSQKTKCKKHTSIQFRHTVCCTCLKNVLGKRLHLSYRGNCVNFLLVPLNLL